MTGLTIWKEVLRPISDPGSNWPVSGTEHDGFRGPFSHLRASVQPVSPLETDTLAAVTRNWERARVIHARMNCWAIVSVRHVLTRLATSGQIEAKLAPHPAGSVTLYRRSQDTDGQEDQGKNTEARGIP